jgi:transposase
MASRRYGRYLGEDSRGRPQLDAAKVKAAEKFDGKFVVISNDDTSSAEDIALGYKGGWIIESCFRRIKQTGLQVRPMFHWTPRRIEGCRCNGQLRSAVSCPGRGLPMCLAA